MTEPKSIDLRLPNNSHWVADLGWTDPNNWLYFVTSIPYNDGSLPLQLYIILCAKSANQKRSKWVNGMASKKFHTISEGYTAFICWAYLIKPGNEKASHYQYVCFNNLMLNLHYTSTQSYVNVRFHFYYYCILDFPSDFSNNLLLVKRLQRLTLRTIIALLASNSHQTLWRIEELWRNYGKNITC